MFSYCFCETIQKTTLFAVYMLSLVGNKKIENTG